jgi:hypothetical protein
LADVCGLCSCCQAVCVLDHGQLPRSVWHSRHQRETACLLILCLAHGCRAFYLTTRARDEVHTCFQLGYLNAGCLGPTFVTRKTTRAVARIHLGLQNCLYLGELQSS